MSAMNQPGTLVAIVHSLIPLAVLKLVVTGRQGFSYLLCTA